MKKYNKFDNHMLLVGIILPIMFFFISMNVTYAYFTATASNQIISSSTGTIKIGLTNEIVQINSITYENQLLVPGDTITYSARVENQGNSSVYAILVCKVQIIATNSADNLNNTYYYTINNSNLVKLEAPNDKAFTLNVGEYKDFTVPMELGGETYGNAYKNARMKYTVSAYSIQTSNVNVSNATTRLLSMAEGT